ncbi:hypothetical protein [uncultured Tenacibaculum sp.]|uniref:hypothetical protein n=1 Tax=uncultured Tenacibaculum sp. TaxID=174713 RepID=UPI00261BB309|nr:hypothetical protein [uncultured Tenacibaculum sp.]
MRLKLLFQALLLFVGIHAFAQTPEGFNYQSVVRDASGNIIANTAIGVQFKLHQATADGTVIYTETHTPTTNAYGVFSLVVGQGTTADTFSTIDWASNSHFLEVSIDTAGGTTYVSMGTTQLLSVPYALHAASATTAENVSGLEAIDEGNGTGWRLIDSNSGNYGDIGENAIDLSVSSNASTTNGALGFSSFAIGYNASAQNSYDTSIGNFANASGGNSTAIGSNASATGGNSLALGRLANASGNDSRAIGSNATAQGFGSFASGSLSNAIGTHSVAFGNIVTSNGDYSYSLGNNTTSDAYSSFVLGRYNVGGGTTDSWVGTDALLEVGNGTSSTSKSNALTILKNGTITAPSFDLAEITDDKALITKEYADANLTADNLGNHTATENIQTGGNWISNDGDDEGLSVNSDGQVTTSNKLFLGGNINLDTHWINGDGTSDNGIQFDASGNVITSAKVSVGGNLQLNSNWISNDGNDEGIAIKNDGSVGIGEANPQTSLDVVDTAVIGNITVGSQSTPQNASSSKDLGFLTTPWVYTNAIEAAGERGTGSTLITIGNDGNFGANDEIHFVTDGASQVDISNGLLNVSGNIKSSGNFEFNGMLTTTSIENQIFGSYDDTSNLSNLTRRNVVIGHQAAEGAKSGQGNVVIGYFAGYNLDGNSNVIIGQGAGTGGSFSNQLHIRDLIYGEFDNELLKVDGDLEVEKKLVVEENIETNGNVIIDQDGADLRAAGAANNVEIISLIVEADGTLDSNITSSSGITSSLSGNVYTVNYSNHFSSLPAVTITCLAAASSTRIAQIISLGTGKVEFLVKSSGANDKTDAVSVLTIIGKRK